MRAPGIVLTMPDRVSEIQAQSARWTSVLVVDDDALVRCVVAAFLEDVSVSVIEAGSGTQALDVIADHSDVDLVISDVNMPEMDGLKLVDAVRALRPALPVVLMSGGADPGPNKVFLSKPFTRDGLLACLARTTAARKVRHNQLAASR